MKIDHHIAQLLYRYQCVIVPNFGAFLTTIYSAEVNEFTHTFTPPRKVISFNGLLQNNDGLLANHLAQNLNIGYEVATALIEQAVTDWRTALDSNGSLTIDQIGVVTKRSNRNLVFEPLQNANFLATSFGLNAFTVANINRNAANQNIENPTENKPVDVVFMANSATPKPNYLRYAAAVAIGLGTFAFVGNNMYNRQVANQNQLVQLEVQKAVTEKIQEATFVIANPFVAAETEVAPANMAFHIVAGKFRNQRNATNLSKKLSGLGYGSRVLAVDSDGLSQVIFGSYPSFKSAQMALDSIQVSQNSDAWIMIKKLDQ